MTTATKTGLIGEFIACAAVLSNGFSCGMAQQDKVDLVAWDDVGFLRIQVKSGNIRPKQHGSPLISYYFSNGCGKHKTMPTPSDYDIIAHVGVQHRRVIFTATAALRTVSTRINPKRFEDPNVEWDSWQKAVEIARQRI